MARVPVINENDTVATNEIRYGDNDRLAARVATMTSADLLVLLSDVDGLYDAPPATNANAKHIPLVPRITAEIEAMAGDAASDHSRGGMRTKIEAGKIATTAGTHMVIASGHVDHPLRRSRTARARPGSSRPAIRSPRASAGSRARSSPRARSPSTPARPRRSAAAKACCPPASSVSTAASAAATPW